MKLHRDAYCRRWCDSSADILRKTDKYVGCDGDSLALPIMSKAFVTHRYNRK